MPEIKKDLRKIYLTIIKNSAGTNMFRNLPVIIDGRDTDVTGDGDLSCAFYVSGILSMLDMISGIHATVSSTVKEIIDSGFANVDESEILPGDIIIWGERDFGANGIHKHIRFYTGEGQAISNSDKQKTPVIHNYKMPLNGIDRKIESIYRYNFDKIANNSSA